jgi:nucleoside-diphosphate-sugar epimerase
MCFWIVWRLHIWGQWCDCSLAKEELGWEAKTSLRDGLTIVYNDIKQRV